MHICRSELIQLLVSKVNLVNCANLAKKNVHLWGYGRKCDWRLKTKVKEFQLVSGNNVKSEQ